MSGQPEEDDDIKNVFDVIRKDYRAMGWKGKHLVAEKPLNSLTVDSERLDPFPSADERAFWGSSKGIDGWQPDFTEHPYPHWRKPLEEAPYYEDPNDHEEISASATRGFNALIGTVRDGKVPQFRFYATNLSPSASALFKHRLDNLCPMKELKAIAENCLDSSAGRANPSNCWLENTLFIKCNELKKRFLNNRQRLIYIFGSIMEDYRDHAPGVEASFNYEALYVYRWEFYRLQYREGKRDIYKRQLNAYNAPTNQSLWKRLISPSVWLTTEVAPPSAPKHVINYLYQGHHWLTEQEFLYGTFLPEETRKRSIYNFPIDHFSEEFMHETLYR